MGWHFLARRPLEGWPDLRRYVLTVWSPDHRTPGSARWAPQTLVRASPFPFSVDSVRLADVTGDGIDDFLVTVECNDCNHGTAVASVYAPLGGGIRKLYGVGVLGVARGGPDAHVHGRVISETAWGALDGLVWFDEPRGGSSVCCPTSRLQTFLRWTRRGWRVVARRHLSPTGDPLVQQGFPAP